MAQFYLINTTLVATRVYHAGFLLDDRFIDPAPIVASGGRLWSVTDTYVAASVAVCDKQRARGNHSLLDSTMLAGVDASQENLIANTLPPTPPVASVLIGGPTTVTWQPVAIALNRAVDEFITTNGQTIFALSQTPLGLELVQTHVNGVLYDYPTDFIVVGQTATWLDTLFTLAAGDRVVFDYVY